MDLSSLLKIETDKQIIDYKITTLNIPIWILIRFSFFLYLTTKEHNLTNPHLKISKSKSSFLEKIKYYLLTLCKHPFTNKKVKVLILGSAINNVFDNNNYYNRLYDDFYQILRDNILIIESSDNHRYYEPRFFKNVKYSDIIDLISKKLRKIILKPTFKDIESLESFEKFIIPKIKNLFNIDCNQFIKQTKDELKNNVIAITNIKTLLYSALLKLIQPNMVIIEDAHYGNSSNLIRICKLHKIKVAEFQHGYIGKNHLAYNWNESIKPFVKDFLPDYMLFWGKYWANNCNIPGIKKEIGFPYIIKKKKSLEKTEKSILILIISSGSIPEEYIKLAKFIKTKIKNDRLFFRPHPVERKFANQIYTEIINDGWIIDENNLHETLSKTIFCVSLEMTTVLFEALLFCSQVILIKSKASKIYIDNNLPFTIVNDFEELNEKLSNKDKININPCSYNDIFSENYENNFINFVNENVNNN